MGGLLIFEFNEGNFVGMGVIFREEKASRGIGGGEAIEVNLGMPE